MKTNLSTHPTNRAHPWAAQPTPARANRAPGRWLTTLAALGLLLFTGMAQAGTLTVTSNADPGVAMDGQLTLREAIAAAVPNDTINFAPGLNGQTITLTSGELLINKALAITGPGANLLAISGGGASRVFSIEDGTATLVSVHISGLTIKDGNALFGGGGGGGGILSYEALSLDACVISDNNTRDGDFGGGILNGGTLVVFNGTVSRNSAAFGFGVANSGGTLTVINSAVSGNSPVLHPGLGGGGIFNAGGTLTVSNSTVSGNLANVGGGILNYGTPTFTATLTVINSTVLGNSALDGSFGGGGIHNNVGTLTMTSSTVSGNSAGTALSTEAVGGGIYNLGTLIVNNSTLSGNSVTATEDSGLPLVRGGGIYSSGTLTVNNSTLSGNSASADAGTGGQAAAQGGGIYILDGTLTVNNSTLSGNSVTATGALTEAIGGGIDSKLGTVDLKNSIVAGNTAAISPDIAASITSNGHNFIGDASGANGLSATDKTFASTGKTLSDLLGLLANNGGPTRTHALLAGSPAIDAGNNTDSPGATDQRGFTRIINSTVDIGAFENGACGGANITVMSANDAGPGSLRQAIADVCSGGTINFVSGLNGPITLTSGELLINKALTITGPGADLLAISGNHASRVYEIASGNTVTFSGLTITGGLSHYGSGIYNNGGTVTLNTCTISGNSIIDLGFGAGGGIYNLVGNLTVNDCTISGNSITAGGAFASGVAEGGGILNGGGTVTLNNSTVSGNSVTYSDFSGFALGGGIRNGGGTVTLNNSTVSDNSVSASGHSPEGGGIQNTDLHGLILNNSIIARNSAPSGPDIRSRLDITSNGRNLIGDGDGASGFVIGDKVGTPATPIDPKLGPLQDNGGPTFTHALLTGSPAIDKGNNPDAPASFYDQRGVGFPRIVNGTVDIGAFEFSESVPDSINDLIGGVNSLSLKAPVKNVLVAKLNAALAALSVNDTATACARLQDFINYCRAQTGKKLPLLPDVGAALIAEATSIRKAIHCP